MTNTCRLRITREDFDIVMKHLFPGGLDEHGVVLLAGMSSAGGRITLHVREVHLAREGIDYVEGKLATERSRRRSSIGSSRAHAMNDWCTLAAHNHGSDQEVAFSRVDLESHQRGYPALLQIARGMPVGALVFGRRSVRDGPVAPQGRPLVP